MGLAEEICEMDVCLSEIAPQFDGNSISKLEAFFKGRIAREIPASRK
jgi:hypothetical protein